MMKTTTTILLTLLILFLEIGLPSCTKKQAADTPFNKIQGKWKLTKEATDDNGNNKIDAEEIHATSPQHDNEITFNKGLTGVETNVYNGVVSPPLNFTWKITNEDSSIQCAYTGHDTITYYLVGVTSGSLTLQTNTTKGLAWYYYNKD
jgi:hypothetical protein